MLYSQLIGKTKKEAPKDEISKSAQLLIRGGFIQKEISGVYAFLPLGYKVLEKIIQVIREEMEAIGGQEILLGSLQNAETWKKTDRWDDNVVDVWFKTKFKNGQETGLAITHEEPLTQIMTQYIQSYKDLPIYAFQFQTKFRNEARPKGGLLRTREFIMKDLYTFDKTEKDLEVSYEKAKSAYIKIFDRLGIGDKTYITFAGGGFFSKYSHEFQTVSETGEDTIYINRERKIGVNKEVYTDEVLKDIGLNRDSMQEVGAIEVGNIFKLGTKFSDALGLTYTDEAGNKKPVIMGSYGIGPARSMAAIVELLNDENGILWPENIAPFKLHLIGLNMENAESEKKAASLYEKLKRAESEVLFDDRKDVTAGEKFADADLIGCPYRVVVSKKLGDKIEIKKRNKKESKVISEIELLSH